MILRITSNDTTVSLIDEQSGKKYIYEKESIYYPKNNNDGTLSIMNSLTDRPEIDSLPAFNWRNANGSVIATDPDPLINDNFVYLQLGLAFNPPLAPPPNNLGNLNDVNLDSLSLGDVISYNAFNQTWENIPRLSASDFTSSSLTISGGNGLPISLEGGGQWTDINNDIYYINPNALDRGYVGIGTSAPAEKLDVFGNAVIRGGLNINDQFTFPSVDGSTGQVLSTNGSGVVTWVDQSGGGVWTESGSDIYYNGGNVGIGTTSPGSSLHVSTPGFNTARFESTNNAVQIRLNPAGGNYANLVSDTTGPFYIDANTHVFRGETGGNERMRITSDGKVGIGTTTPAQKLQVEGNIRFASDGAGSNYMEFRRESNNFWRWDTSGVGEIMRQAGNTTTWKQDLRVERAGLTVAPSLGYAQRAINIDHTWNDVTRDFATIDIDVTDTASSGNSSFIDIAKGGTTGFIVDEDFNVGIGTATPSEKLHVVGNMVLDGGSSNMFIGDSTTGDGITAGQNNIGIGGAVLRNASSTTQYAVAIGSQAARFGNHNHGMSIGYSAGYNGAQSSAYVGSMAGRFAAGQRNVGIGYRSGGGNSNGVQSLYGNVSIGYEAGAVLETSATAVGYLALTNLTTGAANTAIGYQAADAVTTGYDNTIVGYNAADIMTTGYNNTAVGKDTLRSVTSGYSNTAIGMGSVSGGVANTGIGTFSLYNSVGIWNTALGMNAGYSVSTGNYGTFVGGKSGRYTTGENNTLVGYEAGAGVDATSTFTNTTAVGYQALTALTTGTANTAIGYQAGNNILAGAQNTLVGYNATIANQNGAYNVIVGDSVATSTGGNYATRVGSIGAVGNQAVSIGYGAGSTSGNGVIAIGYNAGKGAGGTFNSFIGTSAGEVSAGSNSVGVGYLSNRWTTGGNNVAIGNEALLGDNTSTFSNTTAVGYQALTALTTGTGNTAVGYQAGDSLTTGTNNTLLGHSAGTAITTGPNNILIGNNAGIGITNQGKNIAIGVNSNGTSNSSGNVAIGHEAIGGGGTGVGIGENAGRFEMSQGAFVGNNSGYLAGDNSVGLGWAAGAYARGNNNVSIGHSAGTGVAYTSNFSNTVAVGYQALTALTTGAGNTAVGYQAGDALTTGSSNTLLGYSAGTSLTGSKNTILGYEAGLNTGTNYGNQVYVGYRAGAGFSGDDDQCVMVGSEAGETNMGAWGVGVGFRANYNTSGYGIVGVGYQTNRTNTGAYSIGIGLSAGYNSSGENSIRIGKSSGYSSTGANTIAIGADSLKVTTVDNTVAVGYQALTALTTGTGNTAVGYQASKMLTTSIETTNIGYQAGISGGSGASYNTYVGYKAGTSGTSAQSNTMVGRMAGTTNSTGDNNTALGTSASIYLLSGSGNVALGASAMYANSTGSDNVMIGHQSGRNATGSSNVFIGHDSGYNETGSNKLYIENSNSSTPLIYGEFDNDLVRINGDLQVTGDIDLSGGVTRNILVNGDQYVFQYASGGTVTNYGLYFNLTDVSFDFNNASATAVMSIGAATGDTEVLGYVESKSIKVDDTGLSAAGDYGKSAEIWYQGTGATTAGSLYYLNSSGDWANTDASAASTAKGMLAFAAGTDSDVDGMITRGFVYLGTDPGGSVGDQVFLSETANAATTTAPSTSGAIVRVIGHKVATNVIYFNPSNDYFEVE